MTGSHSVPDPGQPSSAAAFAEIAAPLTLGLADKQIAQLLRYRDLLHARNQVINLTAVRDFTGIERRLVLESLRLVTSVRTMIGAGRGRVMDLGTGGGIPGIVLAIALPACDFTLLDATGKKVAFVSECIAELGLGNAQAIQGRAEELGHDLEWRAAYDVVTARAVTSLSALLELGLPFVRRKGWLILPKGADLDQELVIAHRASAMLGGTITEASFLPSIGSLVDTRLVLVRKDAPTPSGFPRRVGLPAKSPLGSEPDRSARQLRRGTS